MPWTPLKYVDAIFKELADFERVDMSTLQNLIITHTGCYKERTVNNIIKLFLRLGYVKSVPDSARVFEILYKRERSEEENADKTEK